MEYRTETRIKLLDELCTKLDLKGDTSSFLDRMLQVVVFSLAIKEYDYYYYMSHKIVKLRVCTCKKMICKEFEHI